MDIVRRHSEYGSRENKPNKIVLHAIAEFIRIDQAASDWYSTQGKDIPVGDYFAPDWLEVLGLSAHCFVTPSGLNIVTRKDVEGAYHAGRFNKDSLGIEFMVSGVHDYGSFLSMMKIEYLTPPQYFAGLAMVKKWMDTWEIELDRVYLHSELDKKKQDPGDGFLDSGFLDEL
jgi:hypothetical protein